MNRRRFIASGAISAAVLTVFPSFALTSSEPTSLANLGEGFKILSNNTKSVSTLNLSSEVKTTYQRLINTLDKLDYIYNKNTITKLNEYSYIVPVSKKSFLGIKTEETALIVKGSNGSKFYILNEKLSNEFNSLISNFNEYMKYHEKDICTSDFAFPVEVIAQKKGSENVFAYKNKFDNTITLHNYKAKAKTIIG